MEIQLQREKKRKFSLPLVIQAKFAWKVKAKNLMMKAIHTVGDIYYKNASKKVQKIKTEQLWFLLWTKAAKDTVPRN